MMRVKLVTTVAGPSVTARAGEVVDVAQGLGEALVAGGYAVAVAGLREMATLPPPAVAARALPVTAISGVGPARAAALAGIGVRTVPELLAAGFERLAALDGVSDAEAERWLCQAREIGEGGGLGHG